MVDPDGTDLRVRRADLDDVQAIDQLLYNFNPEFDDPVPQPPQLAQRMRQSHDAGDTRELLMGRDPARGGVSTEATGSVEARGARAGCQLTIAMGVLSVR